MSVLSRRSFIHASGVAVAGAFCGLSAREQDEKSIENLKTPTLSCLPILRGHLRPYDHVFSMKEGLEGWRRELEDERRIGSNLLWLSHVRPGLNETERDTLKEVFDACAERDMKVIVETGHTQKWYVHRDLQRELDEIRAVCKLLAERYGDHPALYAWYIHQEIYVAYDDFGRYIDELYPSAVEVCKKAIPEKPVTLSPFFILDQNKVFGHFRYAEPDEYREYWTRLIKRSGFDIIMLQDSGEHFSYVTMEQRRPFFEAMWGACKDSGAILWGNVESAEMVMEGIEKYVELYGRVHHATVKDIPWRSVPMERLAQKLRLAAEFCENLVSWGYYQFGRPHLGPEAKQWYEEYRRYYEGVRARPRGDL